MKKIIWIAALYFSILQVQAQMAVQFDAALEKGRSVQYFKPTGNLFVGDCIPFYHDGTYYLYWLLDSGHHSALKGLGGHQWALSTSKDLVNWQHYPVVIGIDEDWEKSICTGSVVYSRNKFYAFYATRLIDNNGKVNEQLSYAVSEDGIHFVKQKPNPFYTYAPGYNKRNFRDPKVSVDEKGDFHLFVSSSTDTTAEMNEGEKGALVHLVSRDLKKWDILQPVILNQTDVPECPDYFKWNNWYYLVYGRGGNTYYLKSKKPYGPWEYPASQALNEDWVNVVKTAAFTNNRRIAAGWIPNKRESKDRGREIFGGNIVLREVMQEPDGTLLTAFPKELLPATGADIRLKPVLDSYSRQLAAGSYTINSPDGLAAIGFDKIPGNCRISFDAETVGNIEEFGLSVRSSSQEKDGYRISFSPDNAEVSFFDTRIQSVDFLRKKVTIDIILKEDMIDVSVGNKRCIVNRLYEKKGDKLWLYAKHGLLKITNVRIRPLELVQ
jgi:hypothetical protein